MKAIFSVVYSPFCECRKLGTMEALETLYL